MLTRAVTGAIYVTVVVLSTYFGGIVLAGVFGILTVLMLQEYTKMFSKSELKPNPILTPIYGLFLYIAGYATISNWANERGHFYFFVFLGLLMTSFIWIGTVEIVRKTKTPAANWGLSVAGLIYVLPATLLINALSLLGPESANMFPVLGIFIMIWCTDTFAYLVGRKIGKTKLAPMISPNKSWEGFFGGATAAILAGLIIAYFQDGQPFILYAFLGLISAVFGLFGDLFESSIKRNLGLKDSGTILPGHGGLLDRFDSVLFVIPVAFFFTFLLLHFLN